LQKHTSAAIVAIKQVPALDDEIVAEALESLNG
jgi:hypothetical protein